MNFFVGILLIFGSSNALRFPPVDPVKVDTDVIMINKPSTLTCNYAKFRTEDVREISWFVAYGSVSGAKIFEFQVTRGKKENSIYPWVKPVEHTATEKELTIVLKEKKADQMTFKCEVQVLRDNGYGKLSYITKDGEVNITVVDSSSHNMILKKGKWDSRSNQGNSYQYNVEEVKVGQPLLVSCVSQNADPAPKLTLFINDQEWESTSGNSRVEEVTYGVPHKHKIIEGRMDQIYDQNFDNRGYMIIECKAMYDDLMFDKKKITLRKSNQLTTVVSDNIGRFGGQTKNLGNPGNLNDPHNDDWIHAHLLDLLDPAKHMHPGIPYDFYSGYILMVANNVDTDDDTTTSNSGYNWNNRNQNNPTTTHLYGKLPNDVTADWQRDYSKYTKISDEKHKLMFDPIDILNHLGTHGYRVIGFTAEADKKMVWTLERKDFDVAPEQQFQNHQHGHQNHQHANQGYNRGY